MQFENKVVFITGAGGGSGKAIAQQFLNAGATVAATDLKAPDWPCDAEERLLRLGLDVSQECAVIAAMEQVNARTTGIDVLVNNAGIAIGGCLQDFPLEAWEKIYAVNATGTFLCAREVVRGLLKRKAAGSIINIASIAGKNGFPNSPAYCASKAAVIGFTRGIAAELGPQGITVNAICPGSVDTPMIQSVVTRIASSSGRSVEDVRTTMVSGIPMRRFQTPDDVAALCLFLSSEQARNISGESINLDGGVVRD